MAEEKENCPLSCSEWIMFLGGEIDVLSTELHASRAIMLQS